MFGSRDILCIACAHAFCQLCRLYSYPRLYISICQPPVLYSLAAWWQRGRFPYVGCRSWTKSQSGSIRGSYCKSARVGVDRYRIVADKDNFGAECIFKTEEQKNKRVELFLKISVWNRYYPSPESSLFITSYSPFLHVKII